MTPAHALPRLFFAEGSVELPVEVEAVHERPEVGVVNTERRTRLDRTASTNHVFYLWNLFSALFPLPPFFLHHLAPELRLTLTFFFHEKYLLERARSGYY